jgi:hypothetical protein
MAQVLKPTPVARVDANGRTKPTPVAQVDFNSHNLKTALAAQLFVFSVFLFALAFQKRFSFFAS